MKLYGSLTSPYVRKVRVFAAERPVSCEMGVEDPWQMSPRLLAMNPIGKVPVLELDDGGTVFDSLLIMEVLDDLGPGGRRLIPERGEERWAGMRRHGLAHAAVDATVARLLELRRPETIQMRDRIEREEARIGRILAALEAELPPSGWFAGAEPGFADLMVGVALRYVDFRHPHAWRDACPGLAAMTARLSERPSFVATEPPGSSPV
jgi:glutathione S-transferase